MAIGKQLSDKNPDGTSLGQSATDLVSLYGATPVVQRSTSSSITNTPAGGVTQTSPFGFSTSAQLIALIDLVNELLNTLKGIGIKA